MVKSKQEREPNYQKV